MRGRNDEEKMQKKGEFKSLAISAKIFIEV